jgi:hypothetical protein
MIAISQDSDEKFMPKHTFVGFEKNGLLEPLDYIWNETGTADAKHTKRLPKIKIPLERIDAFISK